MVTEFPLTTPAASRRHHRRPGRQPGFTEEAGNQIGRITVSGTITEFPVPTANRGPVAITDGPDGRSWSTEQNTHRIGRITTAGTFLKTFTLSNNVQPQAITSGPDGNVWFSEPGLAMIGQISPTEPSPVPNRRPEGRHTRNRAGSRRESLVHGHCDEQRRADDALGQATEFPIPTSGSAPSGIAPGPDGNRWYAELAPDKIGQVATSA